LPINALARRERFAICSAFPKARTGPGLAGDPRAPRPSIRWRWGRLTIHRALPAVSRAGAQQAGVSAAAARFAETPFVRIFAAPATDAGARRRRAIGRRSAD